MTSLLARLIGSPRRRDDLTFTVYTRAACGCCHKAIDLLKERQRRYGFRIDVVDIDGDPELRERYNLEVPVVALNGRVRFRGVVNPALLDRLLRGEEVEGEGPA
jgi:glutaredoxin